MTRAFWLGPLVRYDRQNRLSTAGGERPKAHLFQIILHKLDSLGLVIHTLVLRRLCV